MFDTHCHLDAEAYARDRAEVLQHARRAGVTQVLVPARGPDSWSAICDLCAQEPGVYGALGIHPWFLDALPQRELERALGALPQQARKPGIVAIGECGLDAALAKRGGASLEQQRAVLEAQLDVAAQLSLPVVLHCVKAHGMLLALLAERPRALHGGVLHSYSGSAELVTPYLEHGLHFSFASSLTRPRAKKPRAAALKVPEAALLVESDGPDQPPSGAARAEPAHLPALLEALAALRGTRPEQLANATQHNARKLFGLESPPEVSATATF